MKTSSVIYKTLYFFTILSLLFVNVSCKDDDKKDPEPEFTFVGEWEYENLTLANGSPFPMLALLKTSIPCLEETKFVFNADKSFIAKDCQEAIVFLSEQMPVAPGTTWEEKNGKLIFTNGSNTGEFEYTKGKNAEGKDLLTFPIKVNIPQAGGELDLKLVFERD